MPAPGADDAYWVEPATDTDDERAGADGFRRARDVLQMRVPLPLRADPMPTGVVTRPFDVPADDAAWLALNNRAFAWHPDQGGWTPDDLHARRREPWFDAEDLLMLDRDGELAGFCWTKVHDDAAPPMGEIFVIAVDPDRTGQGLGRALTVAGLDHLHTRHGMTVGMLYVEADNDPARTLYESLGFTVHHHRVQYAR